MASTCIDNTQGEHRYLPVDGQPAIAFIIGPAASQSTSSSSYGSSCSYDTITPLSDNNMILALLFSQQQSLEWDDFKGAAALHFRARDDDLEKLKHVLAGSKTMVTSSLFAKLLRWFTPLVPEVDSGNATIPHSPSFVWRISYIARLASQLWFHGFALDSHHTLSQCAPGTFLIRFGSQAPHFALALKDQSTNTVVEWRVLSTRAGVRLDNEGFRDLFHLVESYTNQIPPGASCTLTKACPRSSMSR